MTTAAQVEWIVTSFPARAALSHPAFCGLDRAHLGDLIEEVAGPWAARRESALHERRGYDCQRAAGAGPNHQLVFVDRMLITLVYLRLQLPHTALAELYGVTRPTVTRAIHEVRPLLARRGLAVLRRPVRGCIPWPASSPMPRPRKSTCASTEPKCESAVRGPDEQAARRSCPARRSRASPRRSRAPPRPPRSATAPAGCCGPAAGRLGRVHDQTAVRAEGIAGQFHLHPKVKAEADEGYRGLANELPDQSAPRRRNRRMTPRSASCMPGGSSADANPPSGSAWSMSSEKRTWSMSSEKGRSGARCSDTPDGTRTNPRPTPPSPAWSPTAPPADRPGTGRAPNWCPSTARPADHHQTVHQASTSRLQSRTKSQAVER
ncbi:helix-turn-helix domain-containing protein [Streptomyces mirabilis]|uniref:helix-turn-helix domain-containing protein n=1 Tax=Streptomyces mirabilis TaxID=68239 RepID=UPI00368051B6